jgi:hypothetical protein
VDLHADGLGLRRVVVAACTLFAASALCVVSMILSFTPTSSALSSAAHE